MLKHTNSRQNKQRGHTQVNQSQNAESQREKTWRQQEKQIDLYKGRQQA